MLTWLKYASRALAVAYLFVMAPPFASFVGDPQDGSLAAWKSWSMLALAVWIGWQAGRESNDPQ